MLLSFIKLHLLYPKHKPPPQHLLGSNYSDLTAVYLPYKTATLVLLLHFAYNACSATFHPFLSNLLSNALFLPEAVSVTDEGAQEYY